MDECPDPFEILKQILRHIRDPQALDEHPWTRSLFVQEAVRDSPDLGRSSPGGQLAGAITRLFPQLQPPAPPRRGKRLDPRWGEFGLLAALYFTPFNHGTPYPSSLLEAWGRIDPAILHWVYGQPPDVLKEAEIRKYRLVGSDLEYGSASTLSDWHRKGLQRLTAVLLDRERFLARGQSRPSPLLEPDGARAKGQTDRARLRRWLLWASLLLLALALGTGAHKAWRIYQRGMQVYREAASLRQVVEAPLEAGSLETALPALAALRADLDLLEQEARPVLWLAPRLGWVPVYGGDLSEAPELLDLAGGLLDASLLAGQAARPLLDEVGSGASALGPAELAGMLVQARPQLELARLELDAALAARQSLDPGRYSPRLQVLVEEIDPLLELADEGLSLAASLPRVLGAGSEGPQTYLLLVQNEDELRPTGGFITSVGNLVVHEGRVLRLDFEAVDSEVQEDWSRPYPAAPWQLQEYMNSRVLILRDSNWFGDFPTSALWAEYLYAYTHDHSVDGVIAFDQRFLVMLLGEIGPLEVEGAPFPLTDENVVEYMRQAKVPPEDRAGSPDWYRKEFIGEIAGTVLAELDGGQTHDWPGIARVLAQALDERHLLLQFDDPAVAGLAARRGWDNAIRPGGGDFLLVTDTNIGFNKTSAVVDVRLTYDVDLSDLSAPAGTLTLTHSNHASPQVPCIHWDSEDRITGEDWYPINRCYWTYTRVYKQAGVELLEAAAHAIPGEWMLLGKPVPARVDALDEELAGALGFGTLLVVPGGEAVQTSMRFALPSGVVFTQEPSGQMAYRLRVQKQPGTLAHPLTLRIHLPARAALDSVSVEAVVQGNDLLIETDLRTDVDLQVLFHLP